jgi:peptide/nickel transport system ATP-binding protein
MSRALLTMSDLRVSFNTQSGRVLAVDGVSFELMPGEVLAIVGESGSGKSVTAQTILGLTRSPNAEITGSAQLGGQELLSASERELQAVRGARIGMVFQDPMTSFNPVYKIGWQIAEAIRAHNSGTSKSEAHERAIELLDSVGIPKAAQRVDDYPHEFSGGMRQRAMIAMALALEPEILIADEPTTALDVTVQAQILELMIRLKAELDTSIVFITHDLGVVAEMADDIAVMYAGRIVEFGSKEIIFESPQHPYTWGLLGSIPKLDASRDEPLVPVTGRPPSLINLPTGCSFHPRCPYVRDAHKRVEPTLEPVDGDPSHRSACLLDSDVRRRIWEDLREGKLPEEARADVMAGEGAA